LGNWDLINCLSVLLILFTVLTHQTEIRVRYADTDQMQFVYNGKYLEYFEIGRTELLRFYGLPYSHLEKEGYLLPVLEAHIKYLKPAYYDDILIINSIVDQIPSLKIQIDYEIINKNTKELIAEGFTVHVFMKKETKNIIRPPGFFINALKPRFEKL
jgi:acyl-CoA thioester hydrolase